MIVTEVMNYHAYRLKIPLNNILNLLNAACKMSSFSINQHLSSCNQFIALGFHFLQL